MYEAILFVFQIGHTFVKKMVGQLVTHFVTRFLGAGGSTIGKNWSKKLVKHVKKIGQNLVTKLVRNWSEIGH